MSADLVLLELVVVSVVVVVGRMLELDDGQTRGIGLKKNDRRWHTKDDFYPREVKRLLYL